MSASTALQQLSSALSAPAKQLVVGVGDWKVASDPNCSIVTYALGSCIGATFYDRQRKIGGLLHIMLPNSKEHERSQPKRAMYADTGTEDILTALAKEGADTRNLEVKLFGGSKVTQADNFFNIGLKNIAAFDQIVQQLRWRVLAKEVGGNTNRTIRLALNTGGVSLKMPAQTERVL